MFHEVVKTKVVKIIHNNSMERIVLQSIDALGVGKALGVFIVWRCNSATFFVKFYLAKIQEEIILTRKSSPCCFAPKIIRFSVHLITICLDHNCQIIKCFNCQMIQRAKIFHFVFSSNSVL